VNTKKGYEVDRFLAELFCSPQLLTAMGPAKVFLRVINARAGNVSLGLNIRLGFAWITVRGLGF